MIGILLKKKMKVFIDPPAVIYMIASSHINFIAPP